MKKNISIEIVKHQEDGFTLTQIENHIKLQEPQEISMNTTYFSCIDGRCKEKIVGTFGGDAGEWIAILRSIELTLNQEFTKEQQHRLFLDYLQNRSFFYHHTDKKSITYMEKKLHCSIDLNEIANQPEILTQFYELSCQPEFMGCGHLSLQILHSEKYQIRKQLIQDFIQIFLVEYIEKKNPKLIYTILEGYHEEKAIKIIEQPNILCIDDSMIESCDDFSEIEFELDRLNLNGLCDMEDSVKHSENHDIPLFTPHFENQVFIYHATAAEKLRKQMMENILSLLKKRSSCTKLKKQKFVKRLKQLIAVQQKNTIEALASSLPIFKIIID